MRLTELLSTERVGIQRRNGFQGVALSSGGDPTFRSEDARLESGRAGIFFARGEREFVKAEALSTLSAMLAACTKLPRGDVERVLLEREGLQSTGIGDGVAIPHGAIAQLDAQCAALLIVPEGVEFESIDGMKVTILFAVVGPKRATGEHLKTLARVSRLLRNKSFRDELVGSVSPEAAYALIAREEGG
jgi:nitrogen PTS system EIIA component